ncbi:hypothetical protein L0244_26275 [bacterium]|nr:hypothetical protein [bacterium]
MLLSGKNTRSTSQDTLRILISYRKGKSSWRSLRFNSRMFLFRSIREILPNKTLIFPFSLPLATESGISYHLFVLIAPAPLRGGEEKRNIPDHEGHEVEYYFFFVLFVTFVVDLFVNR